MSLTQTQRLRLEIQGAVQGVGFRPFVYRLARELAVRGWVGNDTHGVYIEVEGPPEALRQFLRRLPAEHPPRAILHRVEPTWLEPVGYPVFEIRQSATSGERTAVVLPDVATCPDCLAEVLEPTDRRHGYPFTNCTNCGPRFSIIEALPYDRPHTTMHSFRMCPRCQAEYEDPGDRRFHAQPNACPDCGPRVALWDTGGETLSEGAEALAETVAALRDSRVVAVKGLGGFHLMVDARNGAAVAELRRRKARWEKPLAVMVRGLEAARRLCEVSPRAEELLSSPEAPIVLLPKRREPDPNSAPSAFEHRLQGRQVPPLRPDGVAEEVASANPCLGVMLPSTPLHHLLLQQLDFPVVATSGNLSDEPIATDNLEALERLGGIADRLLVHDRPIARHVDDSVLHIAAGVPQILRRARGWAPLPVWLARPVPTLLAVGAHLKNSVALSVEDKVFLSQHLGDMETPQALAAFDRVIDDFLRLYGARPVAVAHDLHPDYATTHRAAQLAARLGGATELKEATPGKAWIDLLGGLRRLPQVAETGLRLLGVQHHHAHLASCLADCGSPGPALGVTWDGTGYGLDATVWGGEFLLGDAASFVRVAHLRPFLLPGGEAAIREPRRTALAVLWELGGSGALEHEDLAPVRSLGASERRLLEMMLERRFHSPLTTSAGRLFDAASSLLGLYQTVSFEGQAAMALEYVAQVGVEEAYPIEVRSTGEGDLEVDWRPLMEALLEDRRRGVAKGRSAARFHNALAEAVLTVARQVGEGRVALTGGCFQNRLLTEACHRRLTAAGFEVLLHRQVPANDGGLSLGQIAVAAARLEKEG